MQELAKHDTETQSEQKLLEKCANRLDAQFPQMFSLLKKKNATSVQYNKRRYAYHLSPAVQACLGFSLVQHSGGFTAHDSLYCSKEDRARRKDQKKTT